MNSNKGKIIVALDVDNEDKALELVDTLIPATPYFKVGLELYHRTGSYIIKKIKERKGKVFLDLKFHDIPNTTAGAARAAVGMGAFMFNFHAAGGEEMLKTATEAVQEEADKLGIEAPMLIGVTVLTSFNKNSLEGIGVSRSIEDQVLALARLCYKNGLQGVVASPQETELIRREFGPDFKIITPGVRPQAAKQQDQKRIMTPAKAVEKGSDYLVIGRPITQAPDPLKALIEIQETLNL